MGRASWQSSLCGDPSAKFWGRHDFGTRVLKKTGNLKLVMQAMGHVDVKTAMKYQHPELDIVRSALNDTDPGVPSPCA